jgi:uroporphyrinogen-III synthase
VSGLNGKRIALLEARMSGELAAMVERHGGVAYPVPAVREVPVESFGETAAFIEAVAAGRFAFIIFMTGVGASAMLKEADKGGRLEAVLAALRNATTICRGPKPVAVLRKYNVPSRIVAPEPNTATELMQAMDAVDFRGKSAALLHYGERSDGISNYLRTRGAHITELCLYEWQLPEDVTGLDRLVDEIIAGHVDALAVTSQIQIRHLFKVAEDRGKSAALTEALNSKIVVAAVGPVCASALRAYGIVPRVQPAHPKMGPMVLALADYFELTR